MHDKHTKHGCILLMDIVISNASDLPLYQQIKNQIRTALMRGELKEGQPLPSIRTLANDLSVSVLTIRRVYDDLETEGFLVSRAGRGTFVAPSNAELMAETRRREVEKRVGAAVDAARELGVSKEDLITMIDILYVEEHE